MLFESVQVEKVSTNRQRDFINVFLFSDHLIQKRHIYSMEGMIKGPVICQSACESDDFWSIFNCQNSIRRRI